MLLNRTNCLYIIAEHNHKDYGKIIILWEENIVTTNGNNLNT